MTKAVELAQVASTGVSEAFKNRIINGAMVIDQRNAGALVTTASDFGYSLDRWMDRATAASKYTVQQNSGSVTPPAGFSNYLGVVSTSAYSVGSTDYLAIEQRIEGFNFADLMFGSASAKTVTVSFWVRSSLTGTFGGVFRNGASDYNYPFTYTISAANTWEYKTVTIAGATTGTWLTTNGIGAILSFNLGVGSTYTGTGNAWTASAIYNPTGATSVVGTNGATFYITGVQLEVGSTATSFDYRPYGTELMLCQRYCYLLTSVGSSGAYTRWAVGETTGTTDANITIPLPVTMRTTPSITTTGTASNYGLSNAGSAVALTSGPTLVSNSNNNQNISVSCTVASGLTAGRAVILLANNNNTAYILITAEL